MTEKLHQIKARRMETRRFELLDQLIADAQRIKDEYNEGGSWSDARQEIRDLGESIATWYEEKGFRLCAPDLWKD